MKKRHEEDLFLLEKREKRNLSRDKKSRKKSQKPPFKNKKISYLCKIKEHSNIPKSTHASFPVPKKFSLIENPDNTLKFISSVAQTANNSTLEVIHFNHKNLKEHDLGAELLLGFAANEVKRTAKQRNRIVNIVGNYPKNNRQIRLIRSLGVVKRLNIKDQEITDKDPSLEVFDFEGAPESVYRIGSEDRKNKCVKKFVMHINSCLAHQNKELTENSTALLTKYMGEIIGNAEDHSGENRWFVYGYLDEEGDAKAASHDNEHFCEIVIFNFGNTFYDTFNALDFESYSYKSAYEYVKAHSDKKSLSNSFTEENLFTVVALQGEVSSLHEDENSDRGQGTVDLIEFFQKVAAECSNSGDNQSRMALISGKTHIYFDGKYRMETKGGQDIIAFNNENDLHMPPDSNYVRTLKESNFPGALLAIKFPLESEKTSTDSVKGQSDEP